MWWSREAPLRRVKVPFPVLAVRQGVVAVDTARLIEAVERLAEEVRLLRRDLAPVIAPAAPARPYEDAAPDHSPHIWYQAHVAASPVTFAAPAKALTITWKCRVCPVTKVEVLP